MRPELAQIPKPVHHGRDHAPWGEDPAYTERWHKCGDAGEPSLGAGLVGKVWFKLVVGPTNHKQQSPEIVVAVSGGSNGDVVMTFPAGYYDFADGENIPVPAFDATGVQRPFYLDGSNGTLVIGPLP